MRKFREILERKIVQTNKAPEEVSVKAEEVVEQVDLKVDPVEKLREKGFVIKTNIPSKNGRELTFFKSDQAEEAYEFLVELGYEKKFKIGQAGKVVSISTKR